MDARKFFGFNALRFRTCRAPQCIPIIPQLLVQAEKSTRVCIVLYCNPFYSTVLLYYIMFDSIIIGCPLRRLTNFGLKLCAVTKHHTESALQAKAPNGPKQFRVQDLGFRVYICPSPRRPPQQSVRAKTKANPCKHWINIGNHEI